VRRNNEYQERYKVKVNQKVTIIIVVIVGLALIVLAAVYAPSLGEIMRRLHSIPQH